MRYTYIPGCLARVDLGSGSGDPSCEGHPYDRLGKASAKLGQGRRVAWMGVTSRGQPCPHRGGLVDSQVPTRRFPPEERRACEPQGPCATGCMVACLNTPPEPLAAAWPSLLPIWMASSRPPWPIDMLLDDSVAAPHPAPLSCRPLRCHGLVERVHGPFP